MYAALGPAATLLGTGPAATLRGSGPRGSPPAPYRFP